MTYADALTTCLKKYIDFSGRASRIEYWSFFGTMFGLYVALRVILPFDTIANVMGLALLAPWLAVSARRWHDLGQPGWLALLNLVPIVNLVMMYFYASKGTPGPNRFGYEPL